MDVRMAGDEPVYIVTNAQLYQKVVSLEQQMHRLTTIMSVVGFVVTPIVTLVINNTINNMMGS